MKRSYSFIVTPPANSAKLTVDNTRDKADSLLAKIKEAGMEEEITKITVLKNAGLFIAICTDKGRDFMNAQEEVENFIENACFEKRTPSPKP